MLLLLLSISPSLALMDDRAGVTKYGAKTWREEKRRGLKRGGGKNVGNSSKKIQEEGKGPGESETDSVAAGGGREEEDATFT